MASYRWSWASVVLIVTSVMMALSTMVESKHIPTSTDLLEPKSIDSALSKATPQGMFASVQGTNTAIVMGVGYSLFLLFTYGFPVDGPFGGRGFQSRNSTEALSVDEEPSFFSTLLNIIDPVDIAFRYMEIEESACRKRTLCQASATPIIGQLLRYIRPSIKSLNVKYQDAISTGEAHGVYGEADQNCDLVYAECPDNQQALEN